MRIFIDMDGTLAEWKNIESNKELYKEGYYSSLKPNINIGSKMIFVIAPTTVASIAYLGLPSLLMEAFNP